MEPSRYPFPRPSALGLPYEYRRRLHDARVAPVTMTNGCLAWLVVGHEEVHQILSDARFSRATAAMRPSAWKYASHPAPLMVSSVDPPEHSRLRRLAAAAFSPKRIQTMAPWTETTATQLLTQLTTQPPPADLVTEYTRRLSVLSVCHVLGVPEPAPEQQHRNAVVFGSMPAPDHEMQQARTSLQNDVGQLIAWVRKSSHQGLVSDLCQAADADRLTPAELQAYVSLLYVAGMQTISNEFGLAVLRVLSTADLYSQLCEQPQAIPSLVQELLRMSTHSDSALTRVATEDLTIGGTTIHQGDTVIASTIGANRDPIVFSQPDDLRQQRTPNPHVSFGHGPHFCLGATLARQILEVGLHLLTQHLPFLRLACPLHEVPIIQGAVSHSLRQLPVTWK